MFNPCGMSMHFNTFGYKLMRITTFGVTGIAVSNIPISNYVKSNSINLNRRKHKKKHKHTQSKIHRNNEFTKTYAIRNINCFHFFSVYYFRA